MLGSDPEGKLMAEKWGYATIIGMLLYLSMNTCPDIAYSVSHTAHFTLNPKWSHDIMVKVIICYLISTGLHSMIIQPHLDPHSSLTLDQFFEAKVVSLYKRELDWLEDSVHS
jgi:hypothetical protein